MKKLLLGLAIPITVTVLMTAGCTQAAPAPTPTKAPAAAPTAPTKAAEPVKASAAPPTSAPVKKVDYPAEGKTVSYIVAWPAGGPMDTIARVLGPALEKELRIPVRIVNKGGAAGQVGMTELAQSKPDGYTIGWTPLPTVNLIYLDSSKKAVFGRQDLQPVAMLGTDPEAIAVKASSPYKTVKDLVDTAKANPEKIKLGDSGLLSDDHLGIMLLEQATGARFAQVHFDGTAPAVTALLGDHIDAVAENIAFWSPLLKSGEVRVLGIMDKEESKFFPGVKTLESQGYPLNHGTVRIISAPSGVPAEIGEILNKSLNSAMQSEAFQKAMGEMGLEVRTMTGQQTSAYWDRYESEVVKPLVAKLMSK